MPSGESQEEENEIQTMDLGASTSEDNTHIVQNHVDIVTNISTAHGTRQNGSRTKRLLAMSKIGTAISPVVEEAEEEEEDDDQMPAAPSMGRGVTEL